MLNDGGPGGDVGVYGVQSQNNPPDGLLDDELLGLDELDGEEELLGLDELLELDWLELLELDELLELVDPQQHQKNNNIILLYGCS